MQCLVFQPVDEEKEAIIVAGLRFISVPLIVSTALLPDPTLSRASPALLCTAKLAMV
jgi:hypothetical protein